MMGNWGHRITVGTSFRGHWQPLLHLIQCNIYLCDSLTSKTKTKRDNITIIVIIILFKAKASSHDTKPISRIMEHGKGIAATLSC